MAKRESGGGRMAKHSAVYATGNILRRIVGFAMLPVYTRYLSPADYGVVALMDAAIVLLEITLGARLVQAVPKYYYAEGEEKARNAVVSTALVVTGCASIIVTLLVVVFREPFGAVLFGEPDYGLVVGLFGILVLTQSVEQYGLLFVRIQQKPWLFVAINLMKLLVQLMLNIWLVVFLELGVVGVALGAVIASSLFAPALAIYTLAHTGIRFRGVLARQMVVFCWPLWLASLAGLYMSAGNRYFIRIFGSLDEVGMFGLAATLALALKALVWAPFAQYWETERFNYYHKGNAVHVFQTVFRVMVAILAAAGLGISIFAEPVIRIMAAPAFYPAAQVVPYLVVGAFFSCLVAFANFSFLVSEQTAWIGKNNYATAAIVTVLYVTLIPIFGFLGAAIALTVSQTIQFIIVHKVSRRYFDMQLSVTPIVLSVGIGIVGVSVSGAVKQTDLILDILARSVTYAVCCTLLALMLLMSDTYVREQAMRVVAGFRRGWDRAGKSTT